jgi:hypothetical protein
MMTFRKFLTCVVFTIIVFSFSALAQDEGEMPAWMKLAQPGPHHENLAPFVGTWKGQVRMWMSPDAPEMTEAATAEVAWIMGGRFLEWKILGQYGGMPYEARSIEGYSNGEERYEGFWIDTFGTLMVYSEGSGSEDGKSRVMSTEINDVVAGGTMTYRTEFKWIDENRFTHTGWVDKGDGEFKNMEITYERQ